MNTEKAKQILRNLILGSRRGDYVWDKNPTGDGFITAFSDSSVEIRRRVTGGTRSYVYAIDFRNAAGTSAGQLVDRLERGAPVGNILGVKKLWDAITNTASDAILDTILKETERSAPVDTEGHAEEDPNDV